MKVGIAVLAAGLTTLCAQQMPLPGNLDAVSAKAEESVNVSLDGSMLQFAAKWFPDRGDDAKVKKIIAGLQGINVRSYQFAGEGEYTKADVDAVRDQFRAPAWSRIVGARCKHTGGGADLYIKTGLNGTIGGIVVIAAEPKELTVVNIIGMLDPAQLSDLGGRFHIPALDLSACSIPRKEPK